MSEITAYFLSLPWLELAAMLLALAYIVLATRGSLWCWPAAFMSTALYTYIFYEVLLLMDSALNAYYLVMAVYGYCCWKKDQQTQRQEANKSPLNIVCWPPYWHLKACGLLVLISLVLGYVMANYTPAAFPYLDTATTVFSVFATYLVTQKVLQNWLYWIVIDAVSIYLYLEKNLMPTAALFIVYVVIASYGYLKWRSLYNEIKPSLSPAINNPSL